MPLQNRVTPLGELIANPARGLLMGNRGGRLHDSRRELGSRRWASRQWICCKLNFKARHRRVWGDSYSELFFLDEPTAFAAGHRPCFECRRKDAELFAQLFAPRRSGRTAAAEMDVILHRERLDKYAKRRHALPMDDLPDGAFIFRDGSPFAICGRHLLRWTPSGYVAALPRPSGIKADVLTPPSMLTVLRGGYQMLWHPSSRNIIALL